MAISDSISALASQAGSIGTTNTKAKDQLDQKSFLRLMIAQFQNQDPTKPKDPSEFLSQLAQFSTVSGIQDMQTSIGALSESLRSQNVLGGAVLVGRDILAPSSDIAVAANEAVYGALDVPEGATSVEIVVKDSVGQTVRRITAPVSQGTVDFAWDGVTDRGTQADAGRYSFSATTSIGGKSESVPVLLNTRVDSVTIDPTTQGLVLNTRGLGSISLGDVRRVM